MDDELNELKETIASEEIMFQGDLVWIGTPECKQWKQEHDNCFDCISHLGCYKQLALLWVPPLCSRVFDQVDIEMMPCIGEATEVLEKIVNANSREEIDKLISSCNECYQLLIANGRTERDPRDVTIK